MRRTPKDAQNPLPRLLRTFVRSSTISQLFARLPTGLATVATPEISNGQTTRAEKE
jgi:hypothetical protein